MNGYAVILYGSENAGISALWDHAAGWAHGRADNSSDSGQTRFSPWLSLGSAHPLRSLSPLCACPPRFLLVTLRIGRAAGSITPPSPPPNRRPKCLLGLPASALSLSLLRAYPRASRCHAAAAARRAASLRLVLETGPLCVPSVSRPRSSPSALLRTPPRFVLNSPTYTRSPTRYSRKWAWWDCPRS